MRRACPLVLVVVLALLLTMASADRGRAAADPPAVDVEATEIEFQSAEEPEGHSEAEEPAVGEEAPGAVEEPAAAEEAPGAVEEPAAAEEALGAVEEPAAAEEAPGAVEEPAAAEEAPAVEEPAAAEEAPAVAEPAWADEALGVVEEPAAAEGVPGVAEEESEWRPPAPEDEIGVGEGETGPAEGEELEDRLAVPAPIVSIEVVGNERIAEEEIRQGIQSEVGGPFSEGQVARDRQAVVALGWFQTVSVERESVEDGIRLVFRVTENPVITEVRFEGVSVLGPEELLSVMATQAGRIYNSPLLVEDARAIETLYRSRNYILAMVLEPRMTADGVLTLVIAEGEIEDIRITGNTHTKTYAIRRYIRTQPGEAYNDAKVGRDIAKLNSLGWFETVRRDAEVGTEPGKVIVIITVVEKGRTGMASVGGGYSSTQGLVGFIDLTKGNLGGNGQAVSIRGEFGGRTSYEFGYHHPWIATPETRLNLGVYNRLILREAFVTTPEEEQLSILYDERRTGGSITFGRPLSDRTTIFLGFRSDDVSVSGVSAEEEEHLTGPAFEPRKVRSITFAAVNDTRRELYNPKDGAYHRLSTEFAGLIFGGTEFNKYVLDARRFFRAGSKSAIAVRLLVGTTTGDPPYLEQFLVGGGETLRGYPNDRFVGTKMAIVNTEYRLELGENLLGVLFVDVGDAWGRAVDVENGPADALHESFSAHYGYGVGVRVRTPIGPLRLDLGFSEEGTETHFGVRQTF